MTTSSPDYAAGSASARADVEELFRAVAPIRSIEDLAADEVFDTDAELDRFLESVRTSRNADLA
jgi:hypothetical protein